MNMEKETRTLILQYFRRFSRKSMLLLAGAYLICAFLIIAGNRMPIYTLYNLGEPARSTIVSAYTFSYYDKSDTRNMLEYLKSTEPFYYSHEVNHLTEFRARLSEFIRILNLGSDREFREGMKRSGMGFSSEVWGHIQGNRFLLSKYEERIYFLYQALTLQYTIVDQVPGTTSTEYIQLRKDGNNTRVSLTDVVTTPVEKSLILSIIRKNFPQINRNNQESIAEILLNLIRPTARLDNLYRDKLLDEMLLNRRQQKVIQKGEVLVRQGEVINSGSLSRLEAYQEYKDRLLGRRLLTYLSVSLVLFILLCYRIFRFEKGFLNNSRNIAIGLLFFLLACGLFYLVNLFKPSFNIPAFLFMPFGLITITLPELVRDTRTSIILLFSYILFYFFFPAFETISFLNIMIISLSTIYTHQLLKSRTHYFLVGAVIGLINLVFVLLELQSGAGMIDVSTIILYIIFALGNGLISAMLSLGLLPILERVFNVPTRFRLLELSNPTTSPLLQQLKIEAPGTYNHSMLIGDMCGEAAGDLGIDSLLVRVGGYYHDIGKMENSNYFIENQEGRNKHDDIKPNMSVAVIKAHVKIGLELALQHRLPEELTDFILEHHGTTAISYFYHQALGLLGDENVNVEDYMYPGPKPRSKGTALLMIADTVEATVRAYSQNKEKFTPKIIQEIIDDTVEKRMEQGQFDDCDITLAEITQIKQSFFKYLSGYYHKRIEYPGQKK